MLYRYHNGWASLSRRKLYWRGNTPFHYNIVCLVLKHNIWCSSASSCFKLAISFLVGARSVVSVSRCVHESIMEPFL